MKLLDDVQKGIQALVDLQVRLAHKAKELKVAVSANAHRSTRVSTHEGSLKVVQRGECSLLEELQKDKELLSSTTEV